MKEEGSQFRGVIFFCDSFKFKWSIWNELNKKKLQGWISSPQSVVTLLKMMLVMMMILFDGPTLILNLRNLAVCSVKEKKKKELKFKWISIGMSVDAHAWFGIRIQSFMNYKFPKRWDDIVWISISSVFKMHFK